LFFKKSSHDSDFDLLDCIFLYNEGVNGFKKYTGVMPQEISWDMNNAKVVSKLGEPSKKPPRGGTIPIFVDYENLGLQIDFKTISYEDRDNPLTCICLYPPKPLTMQSKP